MLLDSLRPAIVGLIESRNYEVPDILNKTDYAIIKELIKKPRMEIRISQRQLHSLPKLLEKELRR